MVSVYEVKPGKLINKLAEKLQKDIEMPEWAKFVKTGAHKERPPVRSDWWYVRAGAILRAIFKNGPIGISKLRSKYGGAKNRGRKPHRFFKGSGKVIRTIVQQLEGKGYLKKAGKGKGRIVTPAGQSLLEKTASEVYEKRAKPKSKKAKKAKAKKSSKRKSKESKSKKSKSKSASKTASPQGESQSKKSAKKASKGKKKSKSGSTSKTASKASGKKTKKSKSKKSKKK